MEDNRNKKMEDNRKMIIDYNEYKQLLEAEVLIKAVKNLAEADNSSYGYNNDTSKSIDALLGIERAKITEQ